MTRFNTTSTGRTVSPVRVVVPVRVPPGGYETQILRAIGNGGGSPFDKLEFVTASKLDIPSILHTKEGWDENFGLSAEEVAALSNTSRG